MLGYNLISNSTHLQRARQYNHIRSTMSSQLLLQSSDGKTFPTPIVAAQKSQTIKSMLEDAEGSNDGEEEEEVIPLPNVDARTLEKVREKNPGAILSLKAMNEIDFHSRPSREANQREVFFPES